MEEIRRSIEELIARYTVAPELAELDVYVEGTFDADLIKAFLRETNIKDVVPYLINTVDIPESLLTKIGLTSGNRQRVIALAKELVPQIDGYDGIVFIADLDEEQLIGIKHATERLFYTDDTAMELYVIDERTVERVLQDFAGIPGLSGHDIFSIVAPIAQELFIARATAQALGWHVAWIDIDKPKYISVLDKHIQFSREEYVQNCLKGSGLGNSAQEFNNKVDELRLIAAKNGGRCFRGHDFATLILAFIRKNGCKAIRGAHLTEEAILRSLLSIKAIGELAETQLFSSLKTCWEPRT